MRKIEQLGVFMPDAKLSYFQRSKGACQKLLSGFFPLMGYPPPPTPLAENHFSRKPLAEIGGTPAPP